METVILCGGRGLRLRSISGAMPKPMVPIGDRPLVQHLMELYGRQGFRSFVLCLGYRGDAMRRWLLGDGVWAEQEPRVDQVHPRGQVLPWRVTLAETGLDTPTGGRLARVARHLQGQTFALTYGDGLCDVDLQALLAFHRSHGRACTVTAVQPATSFGVMDLGGADEVLRFREKPRLPFWVNGGFFLVEREVLSRCSEDSVFEADVLPRLAAEGELRAFRHPGFWACVDTPKDHATLSELWAGGEAPWLRASRGPAASS